MLKLENITKSYANKQILDNVSISFDKRNYAYCIIGESGVGKTTLFQILFGLDFEYSGKYFFNGVNVKHLRANDWDKIRSEDMQIVFQDYKLLEDLTVLDNVFFAMTNQNVRLKYVESLLAEMDILDLKNLKVSKLSGGEKQRLALVRALANNPSVILLDEPTGNLDESSVKTITNYLNKVKEKGITLIIITHDSRIVPFCDEVYEIKDLHLSLVSSKDSTNVHSKQIEMSKKVIKRYPLKYTLNSIKSNLLDRVLENIPVMIVFIVFVLGFSFVHLNSIDAMNDFYNGISENAIYLNSSIYTSKYLNSLDYSNYVIDDGTRISFSREDLEMVKEISGVKEAILFNSINISHFDIDGDVLKMTLKKDSFTESVKKQTSYSSSPNEITFMFATLTVPSGYLNQYNPKQIKLIAGEYPVIENFEVLLPDFYLNILIDQNVFSNIEECIGNIVRLNVVNKTGEDIEKEYLISGVYKTNYEKTLSQTIYFYLPYHEFSFLEEFSTEEAYQNYVSSFKVDNNRDVTGTVLETFETYLDALGENLGDLIVVMDNSANQLSVHEEMNSLFPNLQRFSQLELKEGEAKVAYNSLQYKIYGAMIAIALIFGLFLIFLNKSFIKKRNKELSILYSLGFSKSKIYMITIYDYIITSSSSYLISIVIIYLLSKIVFTSGVFNDIFSKSLEMQMLGITYIYISIIIIISVAFSLFGINHKRLLKYLR